MKNLHQLVFYDNKLSNCPLALADASQNVKFMCLSAYLQWKLVSVRDKISGGSYRKIILFFRQPLRREETKLI